MRLLIQRVARASVTVAGEVTGAIGPGILAFLGVGDGDTEEDADFLAGKLSRLRIFDDAQGRMNLDLRQAGGDVLMVSQFTLYADTNKGNRPSYTRAADPFEAERLYEYAIESLRGIGLTVETGRFGAMMDVDLLNDGPVTIFLESPNG
jgi:D-tyrosyl-tRNA(Tyr) deacylase